MLTPIILSDLTTGERKRLLARPPNQAKASDTRVSELIERVRTQGDTALNALTVEFDKIKLTSINVSDTEIDSAVESISPRLRDAIKAASTNIRRYHQHQLVESPPLEAVKGVVCERLSRAIETVGLYIPAGLAPLPSTALMLGIPARLAGCRRIVVCTPPGPHGNANPSVIAALYECGIKEIYKVGGVQAIAAMAYGTQTVPKVNKILGPGNTWVTAAKQQVATDPSGAACDMPAGPSEILVVADEMADPRFVASDLLSQAEHGPDSQVILVTPDSNLAKRVVACIEEQLRELPRADIAQQSLENSRTIIVSNLQQALDLSNEYAPEHLVLNIERPRQWLTKVINAGSVFLGSWTPESVGDYCSGTNHVLPTYGYAKAYSGLAVSDFQKQISVQELTPGGLENIGWIAETLALTEGLQAHARAVSIRLEALREKQ